MSDDTVSINERKQAASACKRYRQANPMTVKRNGRSVKGPMSQAAMAKKLGTFQTVVSQAERAFPTVPPRIVRAILDLAA